MKSYQIPLQHNNMKRLISYKVNSLSHNINYTPTKLCVTLNEIRQPVNKQQKKTQALCHSSYNVL